MGRPLDGVVVVAVEQAVAAPYATRQLADLGARVIKIERPDGGDFARGYDTTVHGQSSYFVWLNRSKQSLTLDLKKPEASEILARLLDRADIFIENLAPGAAARLGLAADSLRARHPGLITCRVTGYGSSGPYTDKKAYDLLIQSEVGLVSLTGTDADPARVGISVADIAGGMHAYAGLLAALLGRAKTGQGAAVEVSLFDALSEWMSAPELYATYGGQPPRRTGAHHASIAPYGPYDTREGGAVYVAVQNAREWTRFCGEVLGRPELEEDDRFRTNPLRVEHRPALDAAITAVFGGLTALDVIARLDAAGIAYAQLGSVTDLRSHPQHVARRRWQEISSASGPVGALRPAVDLEGAEPVMGAVPALGEHTDAILAELGFTADTIAAWRRERTI